jgi:hypothetical protein
VRPGARSSEITRRPDAEVASFRTSRIPDTVRYLHLDGIPAKVMEVGVRARCSWWPTGSTGTAAGRSWASSWPSYGNRP